MQKEIVEATLQRFCFQYLLYNMFIILFTLFQYVNLPLALPLGLAILYEITLCYKYSHKRVSVQIDHFLSILGYIYIIVIYYMEIEFYVFVNLFVMVSFLINIDWNCKPVEDNNQYSTIIRFSKTFYHFSLVVSILCTTLKLSGYVNWSWSQTLWWYWMYLSGMIGSSFTILLILISKIMNKFGTHVPTPPNEFKTLLFAFYIFGMSSLIAGMWIVNTLNLMGEDLQLNFGDFVFYVVTTFNILLFVLIYRYLLEDLINFMSSLHQIESRDSSPNTPVHKAQSKRELTRTTIFLQRLSSAYFRRVQDSEIVILQLGQQNDIETERVCRQKTIKKEFELGQSNSKCLICCEKQSNAVLMNCGHGGICYECAVQLGQKSKECFLCRQVIKEIFEITDKDVSMLRRVISKTRISM